MIDLNVHLEGSLTKEDIIYLASKENYELEKDFEKKISVGDSHSFEEFSKCLELPLTLLQRREAISYAATRLVKRLSLLGYIYAEIRFAPYLYNKGDLNQEMALRALLKGLYKGLDESPYFDCNVVIELDTKASPAQNKEALRLALDYRKDNKVAGVALINNNNSLVPYIKKILLEAKDNKLPVISDVKNDVNHDYLFSLHEYDIHRVTDAFKYQCDLLNNMKLMQYRMIFEFSPAYYQAIGLIKSYDEVPLRTFMSMGLPCYVTSSYLNAINTNVDEIYKTLIVKYNFTIEEIRMMLYNSVYNALVDAQTKTRILNEINVAMQGYYNKLNNK